MAGKNPPSSSPSARERLKKLASRLPDSPGVYIFKDSRGREIYVGKAKSLRARVRQYADAARLDEKARKMASEVRSVEALGAASEVEALLLESRLIKELQPKYNVRLKGTDYPLVEIDWAADFPRVHIVRKKQHKGARLCGPFIEGTALREALGMLRRVFRFRTCTRRIRADDGRRHARPCLDAQIALCSAPCAGRIERAEYRSELRRFVRVLSGVAKDIVLELEADMKKAAARLDFERAARLRNEIDALARLRRRGKLAGDLAPEGAAGRPGAGGAALAKALRLAHAPRHIEGVDIANLGGGEAVGAVVTFSNGRPFKGGYRRFRLKVARGGDDPASIFEVVRRRYARLAREGKAVPDVLVVDGGAAQLAAARKALAEAGVALESVVALAKREEVVYTRPRGRPLRLARRNDALRLLMRVRDEAHRFAGHYHRLLRTKRVLGSGSKKKKNIRRKK